MNFVLFLIFEFISEMKPPHIHKFDYILRYYATPKKKYSFCECMALQWNILVSDKQNGTHTRNHRKIGCEQLAYPSLSNAVKHASMANNIESSTERRRCCGTILIWRTRK